MLRAWGCRPGLEDSAQGLGLQAWVSELIQSIESIEPIELIESIACRPGDSAQGLGL